MGFADDSFFSNLRFMANQPDFRLAFITVSRKSLRDLTHESIESSEFWNIFSAEVIGLLDEPSIIALRKHGFKQSGFSLTKDEMGKIHYYAGAFPLFNKMACSFVFDARLYDIDVDWNRLEVELQHYYEQMWMYRTRTEKTLLKNLKNAVDTGEPLIKKMLIRGILVKFSQGYALFSKYFMDFIEKLYNSGIINK